MIVRTGFSKQSSLVALWLALIFPVTLRASNALNWAEVDVAAYRSVKDEREKPRITKGKVLYVAGCPGTDNPISFLLENRGVDSTTVELTAGSLQSQDSLLDPKVIDIRVVKYWYQAESAGKYFKRWKPRGSVLVPELLLKDDGLIKVDHQKRRNKIRLGTRESGRYVDISDGSAMLRGAKEIPIDEMPVTDSSSLEPVSIEPGGFKAFWLTLRLPAAAPAGEYKGTIEVVSGDGQHLKIPLSVTVLPIELVKGKLQYGIYYRGVLSQEGSISSERKSHQQYKAELSNMISHGVSSPTVYQSPDDDSRLESVLAMRQEAGGDTDLFFIGLRTEDQSQSAKQRYLGQFRRVKDLSVRYGIQQIYIYGVDEGEGDVIERQRDEWLSLRAVGAKVFAAAWQPGIPSRVAGVVDLFVAGQKPDKAVVAAVQAKGTRVFMYNQPQSGVEDFSLYRRKFGVELWKDGFDGAMPYAYQHGFGNVWNDFDHAEFRDHNFTYPTENGVVDTIQWEGFREATYDVRYLETLISVLANVETNGMQVGNAYLDARREARALIERTANGPDVDPAVFRKQAQQLIMQLSRPN